MWVMYRAAVKRVRQQSLIYERNESKVTTKTQEEFKSNVDVVQAKAEQLRTVSDIIEFYKNRKS